MMMMMTQRRRQLSMIIMASMIISGWILISALWSHSVLEAHESSSLSSSLRTNTGNNNNKHNSKEKVVISPQAALLQNNNRMTIRILDDLWPDNSQNDALFKSLHSSSCSRAKECHHSKETIPSSRLQQRRVALLYPPGSFSSVFVEYVKEVIRLHYKTITKTTTTTAAEGDGIINDILFVPSSHLPLHHINSIETDNDKKTDSPLLFTHIIRLANLPLLLAVGDAMLSVGDGGGGGGGESGGITTTSTTTSKTCDIKEMTKLFIDWHCHISHWADTRTIPIFTITVEKMLQNPKEVETDLRDYLSELDPNEEEEDDDEDDDGTIIGEEQYSDQEETIKSVTELIHLIQMRLEALEEELSGTKHTQLVETLVDQTIQDRLQGKSTCPSPSKQSHGKGELYKPKRTSIISTRVYELMKPVKNDDDDNDDETICKDKKNPLSQEIACLGRERKFTASEVRKEQEQLEQAEKIEEK